MSEQLDLFGNDFEELQKKVARVDFVNLSDAEIKEFYRILSLEIAAKAHNSLNPKSSANDIRNAMSAITESLKAMQLVDQLIKGDDDDSPDVVTVVRREKCQS